jgi:hypothetical protein
MSRNTEEAKTIDPEQQRQELIDQMVAEHGANWAELFAPGTFGCHELFDRTVLIAKSAEQFILSHPACIQNREWFSLANQAVTALNELYQRIGAEHLAEKGYAADDS